MPLLSQKYKDAVALYGTGMSVEECANRYGVTRQAMHKILRVRGCTFRPQKKFNSDNHFHRGGSINGQRRAGHLIEMAIDRGEIVPATKCEICECDSVFKNGTSGIQAHHDDYNKPLSVKWFCHNCHHKWHKMNKAIALTTEQL